MATPQVSRALDSRLSRMPTHRYQSVPRVPSTLRNTVTASSAASSSVSIEAPAAAAAAASKKNSHSRSTSTHSSRRPLPHSSMKSQGVTGALATPTLSAAYSLSDIDSLTRRRSAMSLPPPPRRAQVPGAELRTRSFHSAIPSPGVRLRFNTTDSYEMQAYNSTEAVVVKPSLLRGWMRKLAGELKYSVGTLFVSQHLITSGNRDITRGHAQMGLYRQRHQRQREAKLGKREELTALPSDISTVQRASQLVPVSIYGGAAAATIDEPLSPQEGTTPSSFRVSAAVATAGYSPEACSSRRDSSASTSTTVSGPSERLRRRSQVLLSSAACTTDGSGSALELPAMAARVPPSTDSQTTLNTSRSSSPTKPTTATQTMLPTPSLSSSSTDSCLQHQPSSADITKKQKRRAKSQVLRRNSRRKHEHQEQPGLTTTLVAT